MDASQYKDYVLFMLFIKYISDKYGKSDDSAPPVTIPKGASFTDMIALKGKSDIGDRINTQIIQPLIDANARLARSDFPNFNDPDKLGEGAARKAPHLRLRGRQSAFSDKTWSTGLTPSKDPFQRFAWGEPPAKQGDYAYLLHIIRSMKGTGKAACILPHGVLFQTLADSGG
jgi:type I restriction-modification system DNA methylase subunit